MVFDGPCEDWTDGDAVLSCCGTLDSDYDLMGAIAVASAVLFRLSGRRFTGECEATIRPCASGICGSAWGDRGWVFGLATPAPLGGSAVCDRSCGLSCVRIPGPIISVTEVLLDGVVFTDYVISGSQAICRTDGRSWPCTQDLTSATTEEGTWEIDYIRGRPVPVDGQWAAARLACQIALAACGSEACELPSRARSIARRGVTIDLADNAVFKEGLTGLREVDLWLASVNPAGIPRRGTVTRADRRRRSWGLT